MTFYRGIWTLTLCFTCQCKILQVGVDPDLTFYRLTCTLRMATLRQKILLVQMALILTVMILQNFELETGKEKVEGDKDGQAAGGDAGAS